MRTKPVIIGSVLIRTSQWTNSYYMPRICGQETNFFCLRLEPQQCHKLFYPDLTHRPLYSTQFPSADNYSDDEKKDYPISRRRKQVKMFKKSYIHQITVENLAGTSTTKTTGEGALPRNEGIKIRLDPNLVAVTGETGSGKSLLLRPAANLATGGKANANLLSQNGDSTRVELVVRLFPPHTGIIQTLLEDADLDPSIVLLGQDSNIIASGGKYEHVCNQVNEEASGILLLSRTLSLGVSDKLKRRKIKSKCVINGVQVPLRVLRSIAAPILTAVDAAAASSSLSRASSRMAIIDQGVPENIKLNARDAGNNYRICREKREELEKEQAQRVLPVAFFEVGDDGDRDLLKHWVDELDDFEKRMLAFQEKATLTLLSPALPNVKNDVSVTTKQTRRGGVSVKSLFNAATSLSNSNWSDQDNKDTTSVESASCFYSNLLEFRNALKNFSVQMENAHSAHTSLASLSVSDSAMYAVERTRDFLFGITTTDSGETMGVHGDPVVKAVERSHELLNAVEEALVTCAKSLSGDQGVIEKLEGVRQSLAVNEEDLDGLIAEWNSLARKHGVSPRSLTACHVSLRAELDGKTTAHARLLDSLNAEELALNQFEEACFKLTTARRFISEKLSKSVTDWLPSLGMDGFEFRVFLNEAVYECTSSLSHCVLGTDSVDFMLANSKAIRGHNFDPVSRFRNVETGASSGEKARLLLAIETELPGSVGASCASGVPTAKAAQSTLNASEREDRLGGLTKDFLVPPVALLYDEIDAHVGGRSAAAMARILSEQSRSSGQVISITHSASVAAVADQHIVVQKDPVLDVKQAGDKTVQRVSVMDVRGLERRSELARMASGDMARKEAEIFAEALMRDGEIRRENI